LYIKGQPVDLMLSKITALNFDIADFDEDGNVPIISVAKKLQKALDIEKTVKKFFTEFQVEHTRFLEFIEGIENERDKKWYVSVILNRLMFIYFLQKKFFIDNDQDYLQNKLAQTKAKGSNLFYRDFLNKLFFVGFAKPEIDRQPNEKQLLGDVPYLNGGLFLKHRIELEEKYDIQIADEAFENLFALFGRYSWHLDDTPSGKPDEMNPDVLGYIFEKYINQKAFGAYYTRPEITGYLCEQTIYKLILDKVNSLAKPADGLTPNMFSTNDGGLFLNRTFNSISDLLLNLDEFLCEKLWHDILPSLKLLDPACGSGAFLVAALKTLLNVYSAVIGKIEIIGGKLNDELNEIRQEHAFNYHLKKLIISNNLFGVDIMEEATEIAKLRLFMNLVSSVKERRQLEPLPNIDFNILAGNSLIGLLRVSDVEFAGSQPNLFGQSFGEIVAIRERNIENYKIAKSSDSTDLTKFRDEIRDGDETINEILHEILLKEFNRLNIKFEQATWDKEKNKQGKPTKRAVTFDDIKALKPFHWGYNFSTILNKDGGFDAIITNPPWEIFKPQAKEFFQDFSDVVTKNKMTIKEFETKQAELLENEEIRTAWLAYQSRFPFLSLYYRSAKQYENQIAVVNGKKQGTDINLYKLFTEQCFNLLRKDGECGIVIPSGIYTDLGAKQLRELLFNQTEITGLFGFENRKIIFEGVDSRFKFVVLSFRKGGETKSFPTAFMRHNVSELLEFPGKGALKMSVELVKKLSPDSLSIMEFKNETDVQIAEKLLKFPFINETDNGWKMEIYGEELHMNRQAGFFKNYKTNFPLYEGSMIWHFTNQFDKPTYWIEENELRQVFLEKRIKRIGLKEIPEDLQNDYETYRLAIRKIASNTNERTLVTSIIPPNSFTGNSLSVHFPFIHNVDEYDFLRFGFDELLVITSLMNSFVVDYILRSKMTTNLNTFYLYQLPVPRLTKQDPEFQPIVERAAKLICTTPEFDDLAREVGLGSHANGVTDETERLKLRAELDALVAHLYGITEDEFSYILTTFPLVSDVVKVATQNAFRDVERGLIK
jgi:hypothetical protein